MPWSPEHRAHTHARIVRIASRLFRKRGYDATGVDALMGEAGLTRGGFYTYFRDKAALLVEALERAMDQSEAELFDGRLEPLRGEAWAAAASARYATMRHRDAADAGCPIPALGAEIARAPRSVRRAFSKRVQRLIDRVAERLGGEDARRRAIALLATWIGAMVLARAVDDRALAEEILAASRSER